MNLEEIVYDLIDRINKLEYENIETTNVLYELENKIEELNYEFHRRQSEGN